MKRFQWKWIFTGSKTCCTIWRPFWIQNGRQNKKNPPIWTKFGFQVDYYVANWYPWLVCYGGHFESKVAAKIQKSSDWDEIWFPSRLWCCKLISIVSRQIVSGLRFQWKLISRSILKWGIGWSWWNLHPHAWILIWGSFGDFCVCIQTQSNLVIILNLVVILPSSASILSGTFLGNALIKLYETL